MCLRDMVRFRYLIANTSTKMTTTTTTTTTTNINNNKGAMGMGEVMSSARVVLLREVTNASRVCLTVHFTLYNDTVSRNKCL